MWLKNEQQKKQEEEKFKIQCPKLSLREGESGIHPNCSVLVTRHALRRESIFICMYVYACRDNV